MRQGRYLEVFQAIKDYHEETPNFLIQTLCRILKVSRSGYYKWLKHPETPSERVNKELMATIKSFHHRYNGILGYRRMTAFVNRQLGTQYNKKRIRRLMPILGIRSVSRRVRHACTKSGDKYYEETILNRDFTATAPNQKWCTDVTYLQYGLGAKAYLSAIKDLYDGSIVAYEISHNNDNPLVMKTIKKALALNPNARPLIHSDRGASIPLKNTDISPPKLGSPYPCHGLANVLITPQLRVSLAISRQSLTISNTTRPLRNWLQLLTTISAFITPNVIKKN